MKVCFQMIVFQSDYVLPQCIEAVLPFGSIVATEGPVGYYQRQGYKTSTDRTNAILEQYGIPTLHGQWAEKDEMVNAGLERIPADTEFIWVLDSDEIWRQQDIARILRILEGGKVDSLSFNAWSFYGGFERYMTGFEEQFEVHRIQRWQPGARWQTHRPPTVVLPDGRIPRKLSHLPCDLTRAMQLRFFHYSYVWPSQMKMKAAYYADMDPRGTIPGYFNRVYLPWVTGDDRVKMLVENEFVGVHNWIPGRRGPCRTLPFEGEHPASIQAAMPELIKRLDLETLAA